MCWYLDQQHVSRFESLCLAAPKPKLIIAGCACDIPGVLYSFSYEQNPEWSRLLPPQSELKAYLEGVTTKYNLHSKMNFSTEVEKCLWNEGTSLWSIHLLDLNTGLRRIHQSKVLFHCGGGLIKPRPFVAPGVESFKGPIFHCAQWDHSVNLKGRRVIVIGNGCTGIQVVPALVNECQVASLTHLVRTKHWLFPSLDFEYPPREKWGFRNIPGALRIHRYQIHKFTERTFTSLRMDEEGAKSRAERKQLSIDYVTKTAPKEYHDMLIPDYEVGCRRRVFDHNYLKVLNQPNVTLSDSPILKVVPEGIITEDGQLLEADAIILASGYDMKNPMAPMEVRGENNKEINEHWKEIGGGSAYNTIAMAGFPNYFLISGPNTGFGHTSTIFSIECGTDLALRVLKPVLDGRAASVVPSREAEIDWTSKMQTALKDMVWLRGGCNSWYIDGDWCSTMW